nr:hypothetical protein [Mycolicibacterium fortuitum]
MTAAPTPPDFRNIVLRAQNVASYKLARAKSILTWTESGITAALLEKLAIPLSRELCAHLVEIDSQTTRTPEDSDRPGAKLQICRLRYGLGLKPVIAKLHRWFSAAATIALACSSRICVPPYTCWMITLRGVPRYTSPHIFTP